MLPFLIEKKIANLIIANRKPNGDMEVESAEDKPQADLEGLRAAGADLMSAIEKKDVMGIVEALNSFFEIREIMPHEEAEHSESEE